MTKDVKKKRSGEERERKVRLSDLVPATPAEHLSRVSEPRDRTVAGLI